MDYFRTCLPVNSQQSELQMKWYTDLGLETEFSRIALSCNKFSFNSSAKMGMVKVLVGEMGVDAADTMVKRRCDI